MSKSGKLLAMLLSVALFLSVFSCSTTVFAEEVTEELEHREFVENAINNPGVDEDDLPEAEIIYEVEEKRDEYTKVYKKNDGSYTAVMSATPLHYLNDGVWEDIDNSLTLNGDVYSNTDNLFNIELPESINSNEALTIENGGYEISFSVDGISESVAVVENNVVSSGTEVSAIDESIVQTHSAVTYNDIAENTDLQYIVSSDSIKENIIVYDKESVKDTYIFTFELNGLTAQKYDDGSVVFRDNSNDIKFRIPRPVMTDSALSFSYDIDVSLNENGDGTITIQYTPSTEWLNSTERAYPITIEPAIMVEDIKETTWVEDTFVISDASDDTIKEKNYYSDYVGAVSNGAQGLEGEVYTKFNMDAFKSLGSNVVFTEAQYLFYGGSTNGVALAKKIAEPIDFKTVTYDKKAELEEEVIDYYTSPYKGYENLSFVYTHFNITKPLNEWLNGEENNGFAIVTEDTDFYAALILNGVQKKPSSDVVHTTTLLLDYIDMGGYNEKYEYHTQPVSRAGTGYVNILTQQLTVMRDDITINVGDSPLTVGMVYDSAIYDKLNALNYGHLLAYGNNWTPNFLRAYLADNDGNVTYYSETGSAIDFVRSTDENGNIVFTERNGESGYSLEAVNSNGYRVVRPDGKTETFNALGLLISVADSENTETSVNIQYDQSYRIDKITVGSNVIFDYIYDNSGLLSKLTCSTDSLVKEVNYSYDSNNNLISVTSLDEDGKAYSCSYGYDESNNVTSVTYELLNDDDTVSDGLRVVYDYDGNGNVIEVIEQTYTGNSFVDYEITNYSKLDLLQTQVSYGTQDYEVYQFNNQGKHIYTFDSVGNVVYSIDKLQNPMYNYWVQSTLFNCIENGDFENGLNNWNGSELDVETAKINKKNVNAVKLTGGIDEENTLCQVVKIDGKENEEFIISGWFKGCFTESSTDNAELKNTIEDGGNSNLNFTSDRFAQIEVSYQYTEITDKGAEVRPDKIVVPFSVNVDSWQYVEKKFELKADSENITVCIRYSKNENPALVSGVKLIKCGAIKYYHDNDNNDFNNKIEWVTIGSNAKLEYHYRDNITSLIFSENAVPKTTVTYRYPENGESKAYIYVNGEEKHKILFDSDTKKIKQVQSSDGRIIRYTDDMTGSFDAKNSCIYTVGDIVNEGLDSGCVYQETIGGKKYCTILNPVQYVLPDTIKPVTTNSRDFCISETLSEKGEQIKLILGATTKQDFFGRRDTDVVQLYIPNVEKENAVPLAKIQTEYKYPENKGFDEMNRVKTLINTISAPQGNNLESNIGFSYEYDEKGNITAEYKYISDNSTQPRYSYEYDDSNHLIRYNVLDSEEPRSYVYEYDTYGNILSESVYSGNPSSAELDIITPAEYYEYSYSNNKLISHKGETICYNEDGNPINLNGATLGWNDNNQLVSYTYTDANDNNKEKRIVYDYDDDGFLESKTIQEKTDISNDMYEDVEKYQYTWSYGKVINQVHTKNNENGVAQQQTVVKFVYDSFNCVQGFIIDVDDIVDGEVVDDSEDASAYMYLKNLQGDIVGVVDESGNTVLLYEYDVWGVPTISFSENCPEAISSKIELLTLTYRGYCYDYDTGLYFVNGRLYNPEWGRYVSNSENSDENTLPEFEGINNVYTYWGNNPVFTYDYDEKEIYYAKAYANYLHNKKVTQQFLVDETRDYDKNDDGYFDEFIYNQRNEKIANYRYGELGMAKNGCGCVATFNAALLLDLKLNPEDVMFEHETIGMGLHGFYGCSIVDVAQFFVRRGLDVEFAVNNFDAAAQNYDVHIMNYINPTSGHFVAIKSEWNQETKKAAFWGYNTFCNQDERDDLTHTINDDKEHPITSETYKPHIMISIKAKN